MTTELGLFTVNEQERTVEGILLPFGETSRLSMSKTQPIYFAADSIDLPTDPSVVTLNREHDQFSPIGRATILEKRDGVGVYAKFAIAKTPEGDAFLTSEYPAGKFKKLSAEILGIVRDAKDTARAIAGKITGAALTSEGAFASAALFSADGSGEVTSSSTYETTGPDGAEYSDKSETTEEIEDLGDGRKRVTRKTTTITTTKPGKPDTNEGDTAVGAATIPDTLAASAANLVNDDLTLNEAAARDVFALMDKVRRGDPEAENMLAQLTDIKLTGTGSLPASGLIQPAWVGEVYAEASYNRRYIPLIRNGDIKAINELGFKVATNAAEPVQAWAGNKAELPSSGGTASPVNSTFQKWGWAADIAREFFDIPGNEQFIAAFLRLVANSYKRVTDKWCLAQLVAAATIVAPDTYPTTGNPAYPTAVGMLIQGIDTVSSDPIDGTPTFAIANAAAWKELIYSPKDALPEYINLNFGIQEGTGTAGKVQVVKGDIGIADSPAIFVGAKDAAHYNELGGKSPLNLDALDIARGGIDKAVIGYSQYMTDYADALVIIGAADD